MLQLLLQPRKQEIEMTENTERHLYAKIARFLYYCCSFYGIGRNNPQKNKTQQLVVWKKVNNAFHLTNLTQANQLLGEVFGWCVLPWSQQVGDLMLFCPLLERHSWAERGKNVTDEPSGVFFKGKLRAQLLEGAQNRADQLDLCYFSR